MKRQIDESLSRWKNSRRRKPVILRGARQVGKTYSAVNLGKACFDRFVSVDLERNPGWRRVFDEDLDPVRICAELEILAGEKIVPGETLLFIDEIQTCPRAVAALRYFFEEMPALHVAAAGSLLDFSFQESAFPVGRVQFLNVHPLSFAEFLAATGKDRALEAVLAEPGPLSAPVHDFLLAQLRKYFFVGGMPEAVRAYAGTGSLQEAFEVQGEICRTYREDFGKYAPRADKRCMNEVLGSLARSVGRQIKYARLAVGYANSTIKRAFETLCLAGLVKKVPSTDPSGLPLGAGASPKVFKAVMADIGIMHCLSGMRTDVEHQKADLLDIYRGAMAEQFVGQEMLITQGEDLYYWSRQAKSSTAEVDYLAVLGGKIHPVEVKSGAGGKLRSMHILLETHADCPCGIVFSTAPHGALPEKRLRFIPLYHVFAATGGSWQEP